MQESHRTNNARLKNGIPACAGMTDTPKLNSGIASRFASRQKEKEYHVAVISNPAPRRFELRVDPRDEKSHAFYLLITSVRFLAAPLPADVLG